MHLQGADSLSVGLVGADLCGGRTNQGIQASAHGGGQLHGRAEPRLGVGQACEWACLVCSDLTTNTPPGMHVAK